MPKIIFTTSAGDFDVTSYYDSNTPYSYQETFDRHRGRNKTANVTLVKIDAIFPLPAENNLLKIYRDNAGTDLLFTGVITIIKPTIVSNDGTIWVTSYYIEAVGYDPLTLEYRDVVNYQRIGVRSGQVIKDLLTAYAPWITTTHVNTSSSPTIRSINITRRHVSSVIQDILEKTEWTFYIDDAGAAWFDDPNSLPLNWGLTEGTKPDYFPEFMPETLSIQRNVQESANDITIIGGPTKGGKVVETFIFNGQDAVKPLNKMPYGLDSLIQFFDAHDDGTIDPARWVLDNPGGKLTEASGRLQINSGINNEGTLYSKNLFSRDDNVEYRFAEFEITSFASGKATLGVRSSSATLSALQFLHALEFDQSAGTLHTREGSTVTNFAGIPIGVGIYSIRIRVKSAGGAIYYIQGGRTATPKEYGELGSKSWTKVTETSADTTAFVTIGMRFDTSIGCTVIRSKVTTDINVSVTLLNGGKLGSGSAVVSDTLLQVGVQEALDFELDCFIGTDNDSPFLSFFTDNKPLGTVRVVYWRMEDAVRERVYDNTAKGIVDTNSPLTGDDGTRVSNTVKDDIITDPQDARDLAISLLGDTVQYQGTFSTTTWHLGNLIPVGSRPIAGKLVSVNLPTTLGYVFNEVITAVTCTDLGTGDVKYDVTFGEGNISFDRFMLRIRNKALIDIIDDDLAAVDVDSESVTTAGTPRIDSPDFVSAVYNDSSGVVITWGAVSGASVYEVRDNLYKGQGQGGSLVYQSTSGTSYTISVANVKAIHKKRSFTFYVWAKTAGGQYSKNPLVVTIENPAPVPQPIRDLTNPNGTAISVRFNDEVESDILSSGRHIQIDFTDRTMTHLTVDADYSKTAESYDFTAAPNLTYYIRYGLKDDFTTSLGDIIYSGIREIKSGAADFSGTVQFLNNFAPSNATTNLVISGAASSTGLDAIATFTFDYTQGSNIATHFALVFKIGGGTPSISDPSFLVPAKNGTGQVFKLQVPHATTISYAVIPIAVTKGGSTPIGSYQTQTNFVISIAPVVAATFGDINHSGDVLNWGVAGGRNLQLQINGTNVFLADSSVFSMGVPIEVSSGSLTILTSGQGVRLGGTTETITGDSASHFMAFKTNSTEAVRINTNGRVLVGLTSTDLAGSSPLLISKGIMLVADATSNASTIGLSISTGNFVNLASSKTGTGTVLPLRISVNNHEQAEFDDTINAIDTVMRLTLNSTVYRVKVDDSNLGTGQKKYLYLA